MTKRKIKKTGERYLPKFIAIFGLIIFLLFIFGSIKEYFRRVELDREIAALEQELEQLSLNRQSFLRSIEAYQSDFFIEQEARAKFNLKKPGEQVAVIPSTQLPLENAIDNDLNKDSKTDSPNSAFSNVKAWWGHFFGVS